MADSAVEIWVPKEGDRVRFTKNAQIWAWYESATVTRSWPDMKEGYAVLDRTTPCKECGHGKPIGYRFRYDEVERAGSGGS